MPLRPHQHAHLVGAALQLLARAAGLHIDGQRLLRAVALLERRQRNRDPVVLAGSEGAALLLAHADDGVLCAVHAQVLAHRVDPAEEVVLHIRPDDRDVRRVVFIHLREVAPLHDVQVLQRTASATYSRESGSR